jgi:hypothetical protein
VRYFALGSFLRQDLSTVVQEQQQTLASYVARDIDDKITQREALLDQLAADLPQQLLQQPTALQDWLRQHYRYQSLFPGGLFVTTAQGKVIADYPTHPDARTTATGPRLYPRSPAGQALYRQAGDRLCLAHSHPADGHPAV